MLFKILQTQNRKRPGKIAVVGENRSLTYGQLFDEVCSVAVYLGSVGLGPGSNLVIGVPPSADFYVIFYAAAALGITIIPIGDSGKVPQQLHRLKSIVVAGNKSLIASLREAGLDIRLTIVWDRLKGFDVPRRAKQFVRRRVMRSEIVLAISTSGTTGEPVLHYRSADVLPARAKLRASVWGITSKDTLLCTGPFTNGVNADFHLILPVVVGCKVVLLEKFHRQKAAAAIARERVSVLCSVPLTFEVLAHLPTQAAPDFSSLRRCISNGAVLSKNIFNRFYQRYGLRIGQMYGGSHVSPVFTFNPGTVPDAVGHRDGPFPVRIVDNSDKSLPNGRIGEIVFDIKRIKERLFRATLRNNPHRKGSLLYTGDLGKLDADGNLFVIGRKSALIKVGGHRVIPAEVEDVLRSHPRVSEVLVYAIRPGETNEGVAATVVADGAVSAIELIQHCLTKLDPYKCPRRIVFRNALPRNQHGKILRYQPNRSSKSKAKRASRR